MLSCSFLAVKFFVNGKVYFRVVEKNYSFLKVVSIDYKEGKYFLGDVELERSTSKKQFFRKKGV